jgi:hypothetical protein
MAIVVVLTLAVLCLVACGEETHVHTYAEQVVKPTCVNPGYTEYTPTCGCEGLSVYRDQLVAPSAKHNYVELSRKDSTCQKEGLITYGCQMCGSTYVEAIALKDHSYGEIVVSGENVCVDRMGTQTCSVCSDVQNVTVPASHKPATSVTEPTCTAPGAEYTFCVECLVSLGSTEIAQLEHEWYEVIVVEPTCTTPGKHRYECPTCDAITGEDELQPTGHTWEEVIDEAGDCTKDGLMHYECACGEKQTDENGVLVEVLIPHAHKYGEWLESTEYPGYLVHECTVCGHKDHKAK